MKKFKKMILFVVVLTFLGLQLVGCSNGGNGGNLSTSSGSISGVITDATNGEGLPGATVKVGTLTTTTGSEGTYRLDGVPTGTVTVSASKTDYIAVSKSVLVVKDQLTPQVNFALSPVLSSGEEMRIVLTWGEEPYDLDSYLLVPKSNTDPSLGFTIYWHNYGSETEYPYAELDVDDTESFGPETITIYQRFNQTYRYFVHNYSASPDLTTSQATVKIYTDAGLVKTYNIPTTGNGLYWYVFDINGSGQIIDKNIIQDDSPTLPTNGI